MNFNSIQPAVKEFSFLIYFLAILLMVEPAKAQDQEFNLRQELAQSATFISFLNVVDSLKSYYHSNLQVSFARKTDKEKSEFFTQLQSVSDTTKIIQLLGEMFVEPDEFINFNNKLKEIVERLRREFPRLFQLSEPEVEKIINSIITNRLKTAVSSPTPVVLTSNKVLETRQECLDGCGFIARNNTQFCVQVANDGRSACGAIAALEVFLCALNLDCILKALSREAVCVEAVEKDLDECIKKVLDALDECIKNCPKEFTYYRDADSDTYGDPNSPSKFSTEIPPAGYVTNHTDCDDSNPSVHPGAPEPCGPPDKNCDGTTLECPPVNIIISSECRTGHIALRWETEAAIEVDIFFIERSTDGIQWEQVGTVTMPGQNEAGKNYSFTDMESDIHSNFYRVIAYKSGRKRYSDLVGSPCPSVQNLTIAPNPVQNNITTIRVPSLKNTPLKLALHDSKGVVVQVRQVNLHLGSNQFQLDLGKLPSGLYILTGVYNGFFKKFKIIKN